jgi:hypothetical protein
MIRLQSLAKKIVPSFVTPKSAVKASPAPAPAREAAAVPAESRFVAGSANPFSMTLPRTAPAPASVALQGSKAATPLAAGQKDTAYDGAYVGAGGRAYPASTPLSQVPPVLPANGKSPSGTIVLVNGANGPLAKHAGEMQRLANASGAAVLGIHNASEGRVNDYVQAMRDKADVGHNPAVATLRDTVLEKLGKGESIHLMGQSQGGVIISRALHEVRERLIAGGKSKAEAEKLMGKIAVETTGGAAYHYPDGPQYVHYVNRLDPITMAGGLLSLGLADGVAGGKGAVIHRFTDLNGGLVHNFDMFLRHRMPFDEARRTPPQQNGLEKAATQLHQGAAALGAKVTTAVKTVGSTFTKAKAQVSDFARKLKLW